MTTVSEQNRNWVDWRVRDALASGSNTELLKALVDAIPGSWFFTRIDATFAYVNQNACDTLGYTREELMRLTLYDVNPTLTPEIWNGLLAVGPAKPAAVRTVHRRKDGTVFPVEAVGSRFVLGDENVSVSYVVDLSEEAQARHALAEQQQLLQSLLDNAPVAVWQVDSDGRLQLAQGSALPLLGTAVGQTAGKTMAELLPGLPELSAATEQALGGVAVEGIVRVGQRELEYRYRPRHDEAGNPCGATGVAIDVTERRKAELANRRLLSAVEQTDDLILLLDPHGRIEYVNSAFAALAGTSKASARGRAWLGVLPDSAESQEARAELGRALAQGVAWRGTLRVGTGEQTERVLHASLSPLRDGAQALTGFVAVSRDVTEQTRAEERLRQVEKMEAVGQMAGGIAHDFNNMLQVILASVDLCAARATPETVGSALDDIREAGMRAARLVGQLLAFSRKVGEAKSIAVDALVERMLPLLQRLAGEHVTVAVTVCEAGLEVWGDESQLEQVVVNLCVNARHAMPDGGRIDIELGRVTLDAAEATRLGLAGTYVCLAMTDNGCGMTEAVQRRIFEPFFTTKGPGVGTGLGLATVYAVAKRHGGGVDVVSQVGKGSRFRVLLRPSEPGGGQPGATTTPARQALAGPVPRLRILLAEDDPAVREIARRFLAGDGHDVVVEPDGAAAVARLEADGYATFDLLVLDAVMPRLSGPDVYRAFRTRSGRPVLFVTGHDFNALTALGDDPGRAVLGKPFTAAELLSAIRRLIARAPAPTPSPSGPR